jgi:hypothetical protein
MLLSTLFHTAVDLSKHIKAIVDKMGTMTEAPVEEMSEAVQDFYQTLLDRMDTNQLYKGIFGGGNRSTHQPPNHQLPQVTDKLYHIMLY